MSFYFNLDGLLLAHCMFECCRYCTPELYKICVSFNDSLFTFSARFFCYDLSLIFCFCHDYVM
jgi:hypothetical protein